MFSNRRTWVSLKPKDDKPRSWKTKLIFLKENESEKERIFLRNCKIPSLSFRV
ncbi:hypothetical protein LEP1GSC052_1505 [Leptospira kmetyi serovar Malaysia str. Bejo-Iso9]|nr:hypothetical protein LEP1GSC052_1505 [Leptospira kmetyi serovar Malaysia str. Bejo-Iso9]